MLLFPGKLIVHLFSVIEHQPHDYCFLVNKLFHLLSVIEHQPHDYCFLVN